MGNNRDVVENLIDQSRFSHLDSLSSPLLPLTVYTLGRFAVYRGNKLIEDQAWHRRKAKSLFKLLLLAPDHQLLKDQVLELLWPAQDPVRATNNLHRTLFVLRRILQPDSADSSDQQYILFQDSRLILNRDSIASVDLEEFKRLIQVGSQQDNPLDSYEAARALYQGDLLPEDLYEDWARDPRETLHVSYCTLLQQLAQIYTQQAIHSKAISCLEDLLHIEPTHEEVHRELMHLYVLVGQRHRALQLYRQAQETLKHELDVKPSPETTALYNAIVENRWPPEPDKAGNLLPTLSARLSRSYRGLPLLGREPEMQKLAEMIARTKSGQGGLVIIGGEPGVGKTRLAEEVVIRAHTAGVPVLYGAAYEQEGHLPYGLFVEAIRSGLNYKTTTILRQKLGILTDDLARLLPELASANPPNLNRLDLELGQARQHLFDAVVATFATFASDSRLVIFLDDLQAADESSLQLLHYLTRRISTLPILILCTLCEDKVQRGTAVARFCNELQRSQLGEWLNLSRLNPVDIAHLGAGLLGDGVLATDLAEDLYYITEGNPFFAREVILALVQAGKINLHDNYWSLLADKHLVVPASVRGAIRLRLEHLSQAAYHLAELAAVIGREFSYELLRTTTEYDNTMLLDLLDEMLAVRLIEERGIGYRFCHGLLRQVLYEDLAFHRRVWLHGQVAQALEQLTARQLLSEWAAILVYHYERAERYEAAFCYLVQAGDRAREAYAPQEALHHYDRALILCREHKNLAPTETTASLVERRAQTYLALSDFDSAIGDLEQLFEDNRRVGNQLREGELLYQLGIAHYWAHRLERASTYLDQALRLAQTLRYSELRAKILKLHDILHSTVSGNISRLPSTEISGIAESVYDLSAEEHWGLAMLAHLRSDFGIALHHAQACLELGQSFANPFLTLGGYFVLGMSHASAGRYQIALDELIKALNLSEAAGDRFWRARLLNTIGWVHHELFNLEQAVQFDQLSLEVARAGKPLLTEAEGNAIANLAADYLLLKDYDRARAYLAEGLFNSPETFMRWRYRMRMVVIKGQLALAEGDARGALEAADESLTLARHTQTRKNIARSCHLRGQALLAVGRLNKAQIALNHSLEVSLGLKCPALIWRCHVTLAQLKEAEGKTEIANIHYSSADRILRQVLEGLTDAALYQSFLAETQVQAVFSKAVPPA